MPANQRRSDHWRWQGRGTATEPAGSVGDVLTLDADLEPEWTAPGTSIYDNTVLYDMDWTAFADNSLTNGSETIDGRTWTAANMTLLGTREVDLGAGLRYSAGPSLGTVSTFTSSAQSTPYIYLPLESIPGFDPRYDLIVEAYLSTFTAENSGEGFFIGVWGPTGVPSSTSAARVRWAGLFNSAGSRVLRSTSQTTATSTTDTRTTHNVIGFRLTPGGVGHTWSGVYAAGFPTLISPGTNFPTLAAAADPMTAQGCRLIISAATVDDASPTSTYVLNRLLIRRSL